MSFFKRSRNQKWRLDNFTSWGNSTLKELKQQVIDLNEEIAKERDAALTGEQQGGAAKSAGQTLRVLLVGKSGHGKSSLINSIYAALSGRLMTIANVGLSGEQVTSKYTEYRCHTADLEFETVFCDIRGLGTAKHGVSVKVLQAAIDGLIPNGMDITPGEDLIPLLESKDPARNEVAMVFFVCDVMDVKRFSEQQADKDTYQELRRHCDIHSIPYALFLTKCDALDTTLNKDMSNLHKSPTIAKEVKEASTVFGIPEKEIFPVKNYTREQHLQPGMSIQILYALECVFRNILGRLKQQTAQAYAAQNRQSSEENTDVTSDAFTSDKL